MVTQPGMVAWCHEDIDAPEHTAKTKFSPELLASEVHEGAQLCSDLRKTLVERRRSTQTVAVAPVIQHTPANAEQLHLISIIKGRNATRFRLILLSYSY